MRIRTRTFECLILYALFAATCIWFSLERFVAADEGFYLYATREVCKGKIPYIDFFYPQMPGIPYLYCLWMNLFGFTWESARWLASLLTAGSALCVYHILTVRLGRGAALFGALTLLATGLYLGWQPLAKTYSASTLALMLAYIFFTKELAALILTGVMVGLAVNMRLFYVVIIPVFALFILFERRFAKKRVKSLFLFIAGGFITFVPHIYFMLLDFDSYWFNNVGYHLDRSHRSELVDKLSRIKLTNILFGFKSDSRADGWQFPLLLYMSAGYICLRLARLRSVDLAAWLAVALFIIQILPDPIHYQYFTTIVPLFVLCALFLLGELWSMPHMAVKLLAFILLSFSISQSALYAPSIWRRFTETGRGVKGITKRNRERTTIKSTQEISSAINSVTKPGDTVIALWPGYLLESHADILTGLENQFWVRISHKLTADERRRYHIFNNEELRAQITDPKIKALIAKESRIIRYFEDIDFSALGLTLSKDLYSIKIYRRR